MAKQVFNILSLFSGGGFLDIGFINQGFQIKEAVEIEPYFIEAYNYGMQSYFTKSSNQWIKKNKVTHLEIESTIDASLIKEHKRLGKTYKNITGIIGGPPCQDYSIAGKNAGINGSKGKLILSYLKIVKSVQPSFIFFENVEGLVSNNAHKASFFQLVNKIEKSGYTVWHTVLNALEYGIPQDRKRVALVGFKNEIIEVLLNSGYLLQKENDSLKDSKHNKYVFNWPKSKFKSPKKFNWPNKWKFKSRKKINEIKPILDYECLTVQNAFKDLTNKTPNQSEHFNPKSSKFAEIDEGDTNRKSFKRLHRFKYSPTVAYGNNEVHLHPTKGRRLTVREALRLQSVPDEYELPASLPLTHKFKIISNGVPTVKAELIATEIRRTLEIYIKLKGHLD